MQSDWFAVSLYDVIFTTLGGEYEAKNRCRELSVLPSLRVRPLKIQEYPGVDGMILKVRNDFWCLNSVIYSEVI